MAGYSSTWRVLEYKVNKTSDLLRIWANVLIKYNYLKIIFGKRNKKFYSLTYGLLQCCVAEKKKLCRYTCSCMFQICKSPLYLLIVFNVEPKKIPEYENFLSSLTFACISHAFAFIFSFLSVSENTTMLFYSATSSQSVLSVYLDLGFVEIKSNRAVTKNESPANFWHPKEA